MFSSPRLIALAVSLASANVGTSAFAAEYRGQVLYRDTKRPLTGVVVQLIQVEDAGPSGQRVLSTAKTDGRGGFKIVVADGEKRKRLGFVVTAKPASSELMTLGGQTVRATTFTKPLAVTTDASALGENVVYVNPPRRKGGKPGALNNR